MSTVRFVILGLAAAANLLLQPAIARSVSADGSHRISSPISFTLYPGVAPPGWVPPNDTTYYCPDLQSVTVQGTGTFSSVTNEQTMADGSTFIRFNSTAMGTATDNLGGTYRFTYHHNHSITIPASGYPQQRVITDGFNLVGNGGANQLHTHFVIRITFPGPDQDPVFDVVNGHGNPGMCDPI